MYAPVSTVTALQAINILTVHGGNQKFYNTHLLSHSANMRKMLRPDNTTRDRYPVSVNIRQNMCSITLKPKQAIKTCPTGCVAAKANCGR